MKKKIKIVVLMGGKSPEHEVSIISGKEVVKNLDSKKYEVFPLVISKDGLRWRLTDIKSILSISNPLSLKGTSKEIILHEETSIQGVNSIPQGKVDLVFIAMHGPFGEDGKIQGLLDTLGIKYTGSKVAASAVGMDKIIFRKVMIAENMPIPRYTVVNRKDKNINISQLGNPPYFVKPYDQGSSVGASLVKKIGDLKKALNLAFKFSDIALIDEYIEGMEVTCAVLGNENLFALPVIEIIPKKGEFFDYESKYSESGADEIVPARISKKLTKIVQELSIKVHQIIGAKGFSRVDFILKENKYPVILEINTIPGLTLMSLLPKAAKAYGLSYSELLDRIIKYSVYE